MKPNCYLVYISTVCDLVKRDMSEYAGASHHAPAALALAAMTTWLMALDASTKTTAMVLLEPTEGKYDML